MATPGLTTRPAYVADPTSGQTMTMMGAQNNVGDFAPAYVLVDQNGQPVVPSQDGTDAAGITPPAGAVGIRGWLSGIYGKLAGSIAVTGTFWQATQPVSAATLPLPNGAAQDGTDASGITPPAGAIGIRGWLSGIYGKLAGSIAVTGTFWQATQPVSAATLPLPNGAAQESGGNLAAILTKLGAVVLAAGGNVIGAVTQSGSWVLSAGTAIIGKVGIDQTTPGTTNKVSLGADVVTTADQNGAAFSSALALTPGGSAVAVGRSLEVLCTVAGNVSIQLGGAPHIISIAASPYTQTFPYAITGINTSGTTATATYSNLY